MPPLLHPVPAADYAARYGLSERQVARLIRQGAVLGATQGGAWYVDGALEGADGPAPQRPGWTDPTPGLKGSSRLHRGRIVEDTPAAFRLRFTPGRRYWWTRLGWLLGLGLALALSEPLTRPYFVMYGIVVAATLLYVGAAYLWNQETVTLTPETARFRHRNLIRRDFDVTLPLADIVEFKAPIPTEVHPPLAPVRTIRVATTGGDDPLIGVDLVGAPAVRAVLNSRLRRLRGGG